MNFEQKAVLRRLGIVGVLLLGTVCILFFAYYPKDRIAPGKVYPTSQQVAIGSIFRSGTWLVDSNATGRWEDVLGGDSSALLGKAGDIPLTGTWDKADGPSIGVFRDGVFTLLLNGRPQMFAFGAPGDTPVIGDWNGDGRSKIGVFRKGFWLLDLNGNFKWDGPAIDRYIALGGTAGEVPLVGDWNGDGTADAGVYRADSTFALDMNGNGVWDKGDKIFAWGTPGDLPVVGDWNGDGRAKIGAFHAGFWLLDANNNQIWDGPGKDILIACGGVAGDVPVVGDWNHSGKTKVGIFRNGFWIVDTDGNGIVDQSDKNWAFGATGDLPVVISPLPSRKAP